MHICFGYAHVIHERPEGYSFLFKLAETSVRQISVETAQLILDTTALEPLRGRKIMIGVLDLSDPAVEFPETVARRLRRGLEHVDVANAIVAPDCGLKYLPRDVAFGKMAAMVEGAAIVKREVEGHV